MEKRPLQDLARQNSALLHEYLSVFENFVKSGRYVSGPLVEKFESEFASFCGVAHCVALNTGTAALEVALRAGGVRVGHRVAVPAMTFVATAQAVVQAGATPVLVDVDSETWNIDPGALELELIRGLDAVVSVHLHGRLAEMNELRELTQKHGVPLFEDAAQAAGARNRYGHAGSFGIAGAFSFYPGKNLGALGEGGALVTNNDEIAEYARLYRNWGAKRRYEHDAPGTNLRMSELMGGLLSIKLPHLPEWIAHRQQVAHWYEETLSSLPVLLPSPSKVEHARHVYAIRVENRNKIEASLTADGFEVGIHYPRPIHLNKMFAGLGYTKGDFPVSEWLAEGFLSLPMDEYMTRNEVDRVSSSLRRALGESA